MSWTILYSSEFEDRLVQQNEGLQDEVLSNITVLEKYGPSLGRPKVDTLKGSKIPNLKELRFSFERALIRVLFAFDIKRQAVILVAGDKSQNKRWYDTNIPLAEKIFASHTSSLEQQKTKRKKDENP